MSQAVEDICTRWPKLRSAVQPPKLPLRSGTWHYRPAEIFAAIESEVKAGTFRLRSPADTAERLIPFRGIGNCLAPVLENHFLFVDPAAEPHDEDFVVACLDPRELSDIIERGKGDPEWLAVYGENPGPVVTKLLKAFGMEWYLQDRETAFPLKGWGTARPRDNRILGVVRKVMTQDGRFIYEGAPIAHAIALNAATLPASSSYATATTMNTTYQTWVSVTVTVPSGDAWPVLVTGTANAALGSSPTGDFRLLLDGSVVQTPLGWNSNMANISYTNSFDYTTTLSAGSHTFSIQGINTSGGATFENAALTVNLLKR